MLCLECRFCPSSNRMNDFFLQSQSITPPNHHYLCVQRYSKRVKTVTFSLLSCLPPTMGKFNFPSNYTIDEVPVCLSYFFHSCHYSDGFGLCGRNPSPIISPVALACPQQTTTSKQQKHIHADMITDCQRARSVQHRFAEDDLLTLLFCSHISPHRNVHRLQSPKPKPLRSW